MSCRARLLALLAAVTAPLPGCGRTQAGEKPPVARVGAKAFAESQILGEMLRLLASKAGSV